MSTAGDRQSVIRTTKVRTALKGDNSWIQRYNQSGLEEEDDEKPWIAEVRASRLNSDFSDPVADDTPPKQDPQPSSGTDSSKTSGYRIRGVFTKTDTKPATQSTNGYIGTSGFDKKASDGYKKIATHTVRSSVEKTEPSEPPLSSEEQERRTEAASKILDSSARRQRSYVLSAAKKYEFTPGNNDNSASPATAFIAKRVVISDDDDTGSTPVSPPKHSVEMSVDEPNPSDSSAIKPEKKPTVKTESTPKQSNTLNALSDTLLSTPESTSKKQVTSPVPETQKPKPSSTTSVKETITQVPSVAPVPTLKNSATTEPKTNPAPKPSVKETITQVPSVAPVPTLKNSATTEPKTNPAPKPSTDQKPVKTTSSTLNDKDLLDLTGSTPQKIVDPFPTSTDLLAGDSLPKTEKAKVSLDLLAVDIIPIDTNTDRLSTDKTSTRIEKTQTVVQTKKDVKSTLQTSVDPIPPTTTTDLLTGGSLAQTQKTSESLNLLTYDVIPIDNNKDKLSKDKTQSKVKTVTTVAQTKTTEKGSTDLFDPIPIVKESTKSPVELFDPLLSGSNTEQKQTVSVTFEQKSSKSSSPWDKWAVPTIDSTIEDSEPEPDPEPTDIHSARPEEKELYTEAKKNLVYIKSYLNSEPYGYGTSRYDNDYVTSSSSTYAYSSPSSTANMTACTYCGSLVGNDSKITIDHLNISCHPECFKCGVCSKPMGDFIDSMFLHRGTVLCENCYSNAN
ncbi:zinc finger protein 185 isoform X2 [Tachysurus fulvidraco]|uniref:zinc finger protein 185 isoform X2 n=1 Tax=Tachysurus fulvidraco TaxID=1234273 RepID=UPI001FEEC47A|nr:zinc finger protein 185 isoform X2 [Tachysurus fulvidraco]